MRSLLNAIKLSNLIKSINGWRETTMETEDLVLNDSSQRQVVEELCELLPHIGISVLSQALIVETIPNFHKIFS